MNPTINRLVDKRSWGVCLQKDLKLIEESYGTEMLNLVLARAYLLKLMNNTRVVRYLAQNHADLLSALRTVVDSVTSDGQVSEAETAASMR